MAGPVVAIVDVLKRVGGGGRNAGKGGCGGQTMKMGEVNMVDKRPGGQGFELGEGRKVVRLNF